MSNIAYLKKRKNDPKWFQHQLTAISLYTLDNLFVDEENEWGELDRLMKGVSPKDCIILYSLEVLMLKRTMMVEFFEFLIANEARLCLVSNGIDTKELIYQHFIENCLLFIQSESQINRHYIRKSLDVAVANGKVLGRPKVDDKTIEQIRYYRNYEQKSIREIADRCDVSIGTVHKYLKEVDLTLK